MFGKKAILAEKQIVAALGEIDFRRSNRARHLRLSAHPRFGIRITMPRRVSYKAAKAFAMQHATWISDQRAKLQELATEQQPKREILAALDKAAAKTELKQELTNLAQLHGFQFQQVRVKQQKTLWGSCSSLGNINLNIQIALLPENLRRYIMLHELVHLRHLNHSSRFWQELGRLIDNPQSLRRQLRQIPIVH